MLHTVQRLENGTGDGALNSVVKTDRNVVYKNKRFCADLWVDVTGVSSHKNMNWTSITVTKLHSVISTISTSSNEFSYSLFTDFKTDGMLYASYKSCSVLRNCLLSNHEMNTWESPFFVSECSNITVIGSHFYNIRFVKQDSLIRRTIRINYIDCVCDDNYIDRNLMSRGDGYTHVISKAQCLSTPHPTGTFTPSLTFTVVKPLNNSTGKSKSLSILLVALAV